MLNILNHLQSKREKLQVIVTNPPEGNLYLPQVTNQMTKILNVLYLRAAYVGSLHSFTHALSKSAPS